MKCKPCKDCKWMKLDDTDNLRFMECHHPKNRELEYSLCEYKLRFKYCSTQREDGFPDCNIFKTCGKKARWFEPK